MMLKIQVTKSIVGLDLSAGIIFQELMGPLRAKFNWCSKDYAADSHKNGTSNIINHLLHKY